MDMGCEFDSRPRFCSNLVVGGSKGCFFPSWTTSGHVGYEIGISMKKLFAAQINFNGQPGG